MSTTLISPSAKRTNGFARLRSIIAFTLVELLAVVAIIAILAGLVLGGSVYAKRKAMVSTTKAQLVTLENAIEAYKNDIGMYPTSSLALPSGTNDGGAWFGSEYFDGYYVLSNNYLGLQAIITGQYVNVINNSLLYIQLTGTGKSYYTIKSNQVITAAQNKIVGNLTLLTDPYGSPWGYYCTIPA